MYKLHRGHILIKQSTQLPYHGHGFKLSLFLYGNLPVGFIYRFVCVDSCRQVSLHYCVSNLKQKERALQTFSATVKV